MLIIELLMYVVLLVSVILAIRLPVVYDRARLAAVASCAEVASSPRSICIRPFLAVVMLCGGVLPVWIMTNSPALTLFVLLLGSAAYIDFITQWVPDALIFILSWVALAALLPGDLNVLPALSSASVMLLPALTLNLTAWLRSQPTAFAAGDLYVLPAVGVWLSPELSGVCMAISLILTFIASRYVQYVPFLPVLYPVFVVVFLCGA